MHMETREWQRSIRLRDVTARNALPGTAVWNWPEQKCACIVRHAGRIARKHGISSRLHMGAEPGTSVGLCWTIQRSGASKWGDLMAGEMRASMRDCQIRGGVFTAQRPSPARWGDPRLEPSAPLFLRSRCYRASVFERRGVLNTKSQAMRTAGQGP